MPGEKSVAGGSEGIAARDIRSAPAQFGANDGLDLVLAALAKHRLKATFALPAVIAEAYPALWSRGFASGRRTGDQHDAFSIAAWLSRADRDSSLAAFLNPDLSPPERTLAQVEGWILGVPGLIRPGKGHPGSLSK